MFSDIDWHWARECIVALVRREVIRGYPNGTFRPNAVVSRAEFAARRVVVGEPAETAPSHCEYELLGYHESSRSSSEKASVVSLPWPSQSDRME